MDFGQLTTPLKSLSPNSARESHSLINRNNNQQPLETEEASVSQQLTEDEDEDDEGPPSFERLPSINKHSEIVVRTFRATPRAQRYKQKVEFYRKLTLKESEFFNSGEEWNSPPSRRNSSMSLFAFSPQA